MIASAWALLLLAAAQEIQIARPPERADLTPPPARAESPVDADWQRQVVAHLARQQRYPPAALRAGAEGTARVHFRVNRKGRVLFAKLAYSSGNEALDAEALQAVLRAQPLPRMPAGTTAPVDLVLPMTFRIAE